MNEFIDAHCHIDSYEETAKETFDDLLARLTPETTPVAFIHSACDPKSFETAKRLSEKYPFVYIAYGIHPEYVLTETPEDEAAMLQYLKHPKAVACGEFGLDYHYDKEHAKEQCALFERHLHLALNTKKPLTLHLREADDDALAILKSADTHGTKIHVHCFTGSADFVRKLLALDAEIYVGFTGIVTFKNADNVREAAMEVPAERLLLETDAPYLAPVPFRGKPAHSGYIPLIAQKLAEIRGESLDSLYEKCRENTRHCYGI